MGYNGSFNSKEFIQKIAAGMVVDTLAPADYELELLGGAPTLDARDGGETQTPFCDPYNIAPLPIAIVSVEVGPSTWHHADTISYRARTVGVCARYIESIEFE